MSSINKVVLVGNLGRDPESRQTQNGRTIITFSVATSERWTDKQGERQERVEWHNIKAFGSLADICARFLSRGSKVYIEGRLKSREVADESSGQSRKFWNIVASEVVFLDRKEQ